MAEMLEVQARSKVMLRVEFAKAARAAESMGLPTVPLTTTGSNPSVMWLAPDQWLLTSDNDSAAPLIQHCRDSLSGLVHSATDASAALTAFRLEHPHAAGLLAMGSGLDFGRLSPGQCARTRLARVAALIVPLPGVAYELYVDRSYAEYLHRWMSLAARDALWAASLPTASALEARFAGPE